jgi:hypothetical protein
MLKVFLTGAAIGSSDVIDRHRLSRAREREPAEQTFLLHSSLSGAELLPEVGDGVTG